MLVPAVVSRYLEVDKARRPNQDIVDDVETAMLQERHCMHAFSCRCTGLLQADESW